MKRLKYIFLSLTMIFLPLSLHASEQKEGEALNIPEVVLEHLADAYEWHIASYEGKHLSIPLPIIIRSKQTGEWHFCTHHSLPDGFFFNEEAHGKIYERMADGSTVRPLDLSITRNVLQIWIVVAVLLVVFLSCARWYKSRTEKDAAPRGFVGAVEMLVMMIHDDVIKESIGEKHYKRYAPYLLTVFFFILVTNLVGLIPIFPGGANVTGNINITFFLALCTFLAVNLFGNRDYWKEIFFRADDSSFRQHDGRTCRDSQLHVRDFPRLVDGCGLRIGTERIQHHHAAVYERLGVAGGLRPGLRVHDAQCRVYRLGASRPSRGLNIEH